MPFFSGISLTRDADRAPPTKGAPREVALFTPAPAPAPAPDSSLSDHFMDKTAWYKELLDRAESPPPIATQADVFFSVGQRKPAKPPAKSKPAAGSAKSKPAAGSAKSNSAAAGSAKSNSAAAGSAKSKPPRAPATARVKETDLSSRKVASIFKPGGGKAKAAGPAVETGIHWDRKEGKAYHVDKSGKRTPCEI